MVPKVFNDGTAVPEILLGVTSDEIAAVCSGFTLNDVSGRWMSSPMEPNHRFVVNVIDNADSRRFFSVYQALLKTRFKQDAIYMVSHRITQVRAFTLGGPVHT